MSDFPAPSPPYVGPVARHSGDGNKPIDRIVLHGTVSPTQQGGAREIARYFRSPNARGSAHYIVDPGEVVQAAYDSVICWHAPPNTHSIGVEMCDMVGLNGGSTPLPLSRWNDANHKPMLRKAARLTAELCLAYNVPVRMLGPSQLRAGLRGICEHDDVSKAWGQSSHWDLGLFPRQRFLEMVKAEVQHIKTGKVDPPKITRVTAARDLLEQALRKAKGNRRRARIEHGLKVLPKE